MKNNLRQILLRNWAWILLLGICVLLRLLLFLYYQPLRFNDSDSYIRLAIQLRTFDFSSYTGDRPPVYPLLILICGMNDYIIWAVQSCLGIAISILLYLLAMQLTGNRTLSFILGLSYSLSLQMLFFETMILSEILAAFFLVLSVGLLILAFDKRNLGLYIFTGVGLALATLTRPLLLFLIPLVTIFMFFKLKIMNEPHEVIIRYSVGLLLPAVLLVGGWSLFNQIKVGFFGITTLIGYNLTNHSGAFMQNAPQEFSVIRDIYIKHRETSPTHVGIIWSAIPEMQKATGLSFSELSRVLLKMSLRMFIEYPGAYLIGVFRSWNNFWQPIFWYADYSLLRMAILKKIATYLSIIETTIFSVFNSIFLLIGAWTIAQSLSRPRKLDFNLLLVLIILLGSLFQALLEYGENPRYAIPFYPLILFVVITWLYYLFNDMLSDWRFDRIGNVRQ